MSSNRFIFASHFLLFQFLVFSWRLLKVIFFPPWYCHSISVFIFNTLLCFIILFVERRHLNALRKRSFNSLLLVFPFKLSISIEKEIINLNVLPMDKSFSYYRYLLLIGKHIFRKLLWKAYIWIFYGGQMLERSFYYVRIN